MLVKTNEQQKHVKFISYTGKYPNLCRGILTLEIDGKRYKFGHDYMEYRSWETDGNYNEFWHSGGECGFKGYYEEAYVNQGSWFCDKDELPEELRKYIVEIDEVFNDNVEWGCCGGCI